MKEKSKNDEILVNKKFKKIIINLDEFNQKKVNEQFSLIKEILSNAYTDTNILDSWVMSIIELSCSKNNEIIFLPKNLRIKKEKNILTIKFSNQKKRYLIFVFLYLIVFAFALAAATYYATLYMSRSKINKDIDKDGIPDINIDINNDYIADINIDNNDDLKPDLNIDYKGNRKSRFNIDKDQDKKADFNIVNKYQKGEKCKLNCDINNDGWPDLNIDIDGDLKADFDIDTDGDLKPDLNLDTNGDEVCDLMCDLDNDNICDKYCINSPSSQVKKSGSSELSGDPKIDIDTGGLKITYEDSKDIGKVLPDDMKSSVPIPDKIFKVENTSAYPILYKLTWNIRVNNFETENLKYSLKSTNGGATKSMVTVPKNNIDIARNILIPAKSMQTYTLSFRFVGINAEQNIDQNRTFDGIINAYYEE